MCIRDSGKNEKMSVLPKEMWSAWENVCGKKRDVVRMGKCLCGKREMRSEWESVCITKRDVVKMRKDVYKRQRLDGTLKNAAVPYRKNSHRQYPPATSIMSMMPPARTPAQAVLLSFAIFL